MGTSINYPGSPNWAPTKSETTRAGGVGNITPQKASSIVNNFVDEMVSAPHLGFGPALSSQQGGIIPNAGGGGAGGGGGRGGGSGGTRRGGGSVRTVARGVGGFLADVGSKGFREALAERGLTDLSGKSPDEIALAIADLLCGPSSLIEECALRDALIALVLAWSEGKTELNALAESVTATAQNIEAVLHEFFGHYIFEVFKTVGYQGVLDKHGFEKAETMAGQIREFIDVKIAGVEMSRQLSSVDWNGAPGAAIIDGIVTDTIAIFGETRQ